MKDDNLIIVIIVSVLLLFLGFWRFGFGSMGMVGFGGMWLFGWLFMTLVFISLILFIVWLIKQIQNSDIRKR